MPATDFLTIRLYPNEVGCDYTIRRTRRLLAGLFRSGSPRDVGFGIRRTLIESA